MIKKIFLLCIAMLLIVQNAALAKDKGLPEEDRINIAVEVTDSSRYDELGTAPLLENFLGNKLVEKNLVNVIDTKIFDVEETAVPADNPTSAEDIGSILVFDAVEIRSHDSTPEDFNQNFYKNLGATYVVRCEVLGIGAIKVPDATIGAVTGIIGGGLGLAGSGSKDRDKTLRRVGTGIGLAGFIGMSDATKRTALNTVVNMQFISVETGQIIWEENFIGHAIKHHKPRKGFENEWEQAYNESVADSAKLIAKRVNKYVDNVIIKGKNDKNFKSKHSLVDARKLF